MKQIPNEVLVNKTAEYMILNDLSDLPIEYIKGSEGHWSKICQMCLNRQDARAIKNIHSNWKRNSFNFRNLVFDKLLNRCGEASKNSIDAASVETKSIDADSIFSNSINETLICSEPEYGVPHETFFMPFNKFKKYISGIRRKILKQSINLKITQLLNKKGINCTVKSKPIFLTTSMKYESYIAKGTFHCVLKNKCGLKFDVLFFKDLSQNSIKIDIFWVGSCKHGKLKNEIDRISGKRRQLLAFKLFTYGTNRIRSESVIFASKKPKKSTGVILNKNTLATIKYELRHERDLFPDIITDLAAAKLMCEKLCRKSDLLPGFIQFCALNPFGFLMISDIQIKIWLKVQELSIFWFIDATGGVSENIPNQKHPLYYSIVMHDKKTKQIVPIAEFVTTSQTQVSISGYLNIIRNILQANITSKKKFSFAPIFVSDFSWAIINSVLDVFNRCNIMQYIKHCFYSLNDKETAFEMPTQIQICAAHFLKLIIKKIKKLKIDENTKKIGIYCFTLLQNAVSIDDFERLLINIFNLFNQKYYSQSCVESIAFLRKKLIERNIGFLYYSDKKCNQSQNQKFENNNEFIKCETFKNLKQNSPFTIYFATLLAKYNKIVSEDNDKADTSTNDYFSPAVFNIFKNYLYIMPMWSGVMLGKWFANNPDYLNNESRLTNNPVECRFHHLKNYELKNYKVKPSALSSIVYENLSSKYFEHYSGIFVEPKNKQQKKKKSNYINDQEETWCKNKKRFNREKGIYYREQKDFCPLTEDLENRIASFTKETSTSSLKKNQIDSIWLGMQDTSFENTKKLCLDNKDLFVNIIASYRNLKTKIYEFEIIDQSFFDIIINIKGFNDNFVPLKTPSDGNCFYHAINMQFKTSNDVGYECKKLRLASLFIFIYHETFFRDICLNYFKTKQRENFYEKFVISIRTDKHWASELNILVCSIVFNKPIHVYEMLDEHQSHTCLFSANNQVSDENPINIGFKINHFVALLSLLENLSSPLPTNNIFKNYKLDQISLNLE